MGVHAASEQADWRDRFSDPALATHISFERGVLLAAHFRQEAYSYGLMVYEVDGTQSSEEIASLVEQHLKPLLA